MPAEEGADAVRSEIRHAVLAMSREDDRARQDYLVPVDASLEVAQDVEPPRDVVAEVAQGLHDLASQHAVVDPVSVAVEFLIIFDEWLAQGLHARSLVIAIIKGPDVGHVDFDLSIDHVQLVELADNV